jgi:hypothetical protein
MPTLKINEEGQLVNEEGEVFELEGEAVTVEGVKTQADIDKTVNERLARERQKHDELKKAAEKAPELQRMLDEQAAKVRELETEAEKIKATVEQESAAQINKYRQEAERYKTEAQRRAEELETFQAQTSILAKAGSHFNDPATDLVPHLLNVRKREPILDENGKATGEFRDTFKLRVKNDKGEESEEYLPLDKAIDAWAEAHPHHVRSQAGSGSGGSGRITPGTMNLKRSEMNTKQRAEFVGKHGYEAYTALPE